MAELWILLKSFYNLFQVVQLLYRFASKTIHDVLPKYTLIFTCYINMFFFLNWRWHGRWHSGFNHLTKTNYDQMLFIFLLILTIKGAGPLIDNYISWLWSVLFLSFFCPSFSSSLVLISWHPESHLWVVSKSSEVSKWILANDSKDDQLSFFVNRNV